MIHNERELKTKKKKNARTNYTKPIVLHIRVHTKNTFLKNLSARLGNVHKIIFHNMIRH